MSRIQRFFKSFHLPRSQRVGLGVIFGLFLGGTLTAVWFTWHSHIDHRSLLEEHKDKIATVEKKHTKENSDYIGRQKFTPFTFDPNTIDEKGWRNLGFSPKQSRMIMNYRSKGGRFHIKSDLRKLYCVDDETYAILEDYILLPEDMPHQSVVRERRETSHADTTRVRRTFLCLDLNVCDSIELETLRGVGAVLAKRIVKYRNALGGFYDVSQLKEVYGLSAETFAQIQPYVFLRELKLRPLYVNTASIETLKAHPYLDYYQAKSVYTYRLHHQKIHGMEEMATIPLLDERTCKKIAPYLCFDTMP